MARKSLFELLKERVLILDGGMGTSLMKRGLAPGTPGELWNLERPDAVREVHRTFLEAGCDVVQTNTFGGTRLRLEAHGLADRFEEINRAAAILAREAAGEEHYAAGNIGPSGLFMPPVGDADPGTLEEAYAQQAKILAEGGADYISIETMIDLEEARIALRAARNAGPDLPVSVTLVFEKKKRGFFTPMGNRPEEAARILSEEGADLVGANCSMGSREMREMAGAMTDNAGVPVVMKPNAGLPETEGSRTVYRQDPEEFAEDLVAMVRGGVRVVGGCCGTDERFIAALRRRIDSM